ncbi:MAG: M14 family metallopeptidase [Burkholderiaceae bacterium]
MDNLSKLVDCFSANYVEARQKFISECDLQSLIVKSYINENAEGFRGEKLYADVVRIGRADAEKTILLLSGTHGVEGYCGSGAQISLLRTGIFSNLPDQLSVLMIHAMNPYGFSHDRRVTEDNVDLNRNFLDFTAASRPASEYYKLHEFLLPKDWDGPGRELADAELGRYMREHGMVAFQAAISSGQYSFPDGIFYGGAQPTWSNTMFRSVLTEYLINTKKLAVVDFHTGLGPYAYGELIAKGTRAEKTRAAAWYGSQVTDPEEGTSTSAVLDGMVANGISETLCNAELTFVTLEFGTIPVFEVLTALRGDNWLYHNQGVDGLLRAKIKQGIREAFYPDSDHWKMEVLKRTHEVVAMTVAGIDSNFSS